MSNKPPKKWIENQRWVDIETIFQYSSHTLKQLINGITQKLDELGYDKETCTIRYYNYAGDSEFIFTNKRLETDEEYNKRIERLEKQREKRKNNPKPIMSEEEKKERALYKQLKKKYDR